VNSGAQPLALGSVVAIVISKPRAASRSTTSSVNLSEPPIASHGTTSRSRGPPRASTFAKGISSDTSVRSVSPPRGIAGQPRWSCLP